MAQANSWWIRNRICQEENLIDLGMMQGRIWVRNEFKLTYDRHGTMKELGIKNEMFKEGNQTGLARHGEKKK